MNPSEHIGLSIQMSPKTLSNIQNSNSKQVPESLSKNGSPDQIHVRSNYVNSIAEKYEEIEGELSSDCSQSSLPPSEFTKYEEPETNEVIESESLEDEDNPYQTTQHNSNIVLS